MADLPISLACADYARVMPLAAVMIDTPGIQLTMVLGRAGKWTDRAEMLRRATADATVTGGEGSMAQHLYRIDKGDRSHVGLPVFPLRNLGGRDIYVKAGSPLKSLKDLAGKRVGTYSVTAGGSIWYRHFMRRAGLDPASMPSVARPASSASPRGGSRSRSSSPTAWRLEVRRSRSIRDAGPSTWSCRGRSGWRAARAPCRHG